MIIVDLQTGTKVEFWHLSNGFGLLWQSFKIHLVRKRVKLHKRWLKSPNQAFLQTNVYSKHNKAFPDTVHKRNCAHKKPNFAQNSLFHVLWRSKMLCKMMCLVLDDHLSSAQHLARVAHHFVSLKKETKSVSSRRLNVLRDDSYNEQRIVSKAKEALTLAPKLKRQVRQPLIMPK